MKNPFKSQVPQPEQQPALADFDYINLQRTDDIRLIELHPSNTRSSEHPQLSLIHVNIFDLPLYTAVSYVWGPPRDLVSLTIDNSVLRVRPNLIRVLRSLCDDHETRYLWIDAICINQSDRTERNAQVRLMGEIYSRANYVIAYLEGRRNSHLKELFWVAESIYRGAQRNEIRPIDSPSRDRLLFQNPFFSRRWIVQEACLARSVILHCGGYEFPMDMLEHYLNIPRASYGDSPAARLCRLRQRITSGQFVLEQLLYDQERAVCSEPLDKVYALLSMSQTAKLHPPVDYGLQPLQLMISVLQVSAMHEHLPTSRVLSFACFLKQHLRIPPADIDKGIRGEIIFDIEQPAPRFSLDVPLRGRIHAHRASAPTQDYLRDLRQRMSTIIKYPNLSLVVDREAGDNNRQESLSILHTPAELSEHSQSCARIPAADQCSFSFETMAGARLGDLSSSFVTAGDEIWQFPRTPVALVARPTGTGFDLVGRACIFKDGIDTETRRGKSHSSTKLEDLLDWIKDTPPQYDGQDPDPQKKVLFAVPQLLLLMKWVDLAPEERRR